MLHFAMATRRFDDTNERTLFDREVKNTSSGQSQVRTSVLKLDGLRFLRAFLGYSRNRNVSIYILATTHRESDKLDVAEQIQVEPSSYRHRLGAWFKWWARYRYEASYR
jgi:hypothetical protein